MRPRHVCKVYLRGEGQVGNESVGRSENEAGNRERGDETEQDDTGSVICFLRVPGTNPPGP